MQEPTLDPTIPTSPIRVLLVDHDERVRESLARLLGISRRVAVVGSAGQAGVAVELLASEHPEVVVIDPRMPDADAGRALIDRLRALDADLRIVILCRSEALDDPDFLAAADSCVRKSFRTHELVDAVIAAARPPAADRRAAPSART